MTQGVLCDHLEEWEAWEMERSFKGEVIKKKMKCVSESSAWVRKEEAVWYDIL